MGTHLNSGLLKGLGWTCAGIMAVAAILMFATA
jgi:hypothetical protein